MVPGISWHQHSIIYQLMLRRIKIYGSKERRQPMPIARYLVTGGAGFIGSHIAEALLNQGKNVCVFDNLATGKEANLAGLKGHIQFIEGNLRDLNAVKAAMQGIE